MRDYTVISADTHLEVSPDRWRPFVDAEFRRFVPKVVRLDNGGHGWLMPGSDKPVPLGTNHAAGMGWENIKATGISYDDNPSGSGDGEQRMGEMDRDGVDAEILFPAVSGQRTLAGKVPGEAYVAVAAGYNDWLTEYCAADYDRLLGAAILPVSNIDDSVAELRRVAGRPGIRTVVLHDWPNGSGVPAPDDDTFWAAALELGVPISAHISFGGGQAAEMASWPSELMNAAPFNVLLTRSGGATGYVMSQMITAGVFDRFPDFRLAIAECNLGWIPYYAEQADTNYTRNRHWAKIPELGHMPSWYVTRNFLYGFQGDAYGVKNRHAVGVENLMWATDFPHMASDWPRSMELVDELFADVPDDEREQMVCTNAEEFYGLKQAATV